MNKTNNAKLTDVSQSLRKNMTKEERHLWYDFLKSLPQTVHRQKVFGNYVADFYIAVGKLIIEIDGSQHYESDKAQADKIRDKYFNSLGLTVLRYSNRDVRYNFKGVCEDILNKLNTSSDS